MVQSYPCCRCLLLCSVLMILFQVAYSQLQPVNKIFKDTIASSRDSNPSTATKVNQRFTNEKQLLLQKVKTALPDSVPHLRKDSLSVFSKESVRFKKDSSIKKIRQSIGDERKLLAQQIRCFAPDSFPFRKKDSSRTSFANSAYKNVRRTVESNISSTTKSVLSGWRLPKKDSIIGAFNPFKKLMHLRPVFRLDGGMVSYNFNYRSFIDTPFAEKDIMQHNITGRFGVTVARYFPFQINYRIRQTNSGFFKNLYDIQVSFSGAEFNNRLKGEMRTRLLALAPNIKDSLLEKLYELKQLDLLKLNNRLKTIFYPQKLIEANEILKVPGLTWDTRLPDSINSKKEDSLKNAAKLFLTQYANTKKEYDQLSKQVDTLKEKHQRIVRKINKYKRLINGNWDGLQTSRDWKNKLREYGMEDIAMPAKYRWLLGVKNFSLGRTPVNHSELTAKNISVNGISLEYNSWYYFALSAGAVNYRFRDFALNGVRKKPQFFYLVRAGIGRLEKNNFILTGFRGQKQLYAGNSNGGLTIPVTGISAESRIAINATSYITAEVAKSMAPDFRNNPAISSSKFTLADKNNQAFAIHLYSLIPRTNSKIDASYKKTGANFQSFSSYTTNAEMESWSVKADQNLFKRKVRLSASVRKNEFSNPFIVQNYKSNTVFKSLSGSLHMRKWPVVMVGYQPLSQLTKVDNQVYENRFQTFTATLFHQYKVKQLRLSTTMMVNKFFNNSSDSGFLFYNATNSYLAQSFFFQSFSATVGGSYTKNSNYTLQLLEAGIQPNIPRFGSVGVGLKINNLNHALIKVGGYVTANIRMFKQDQLLLSYEHGYLPGNRHGLVRNEMGAVQFIKTFKFR
jgi:hypothetical protein